MAKPWASSEEKGEDALLQGTGELGWVVVKKRPIGTKGVGWGFEDGASSSAGL